MVERALNPEGGLATNYQFLARYNRWFNERLYAASERLSDGQRKHQQAAFFGSIHGTLGHILWGDVLWLRRFAALTESSTAYAFPPELLELPQADAATDAALGVPPASAGRSPWADWQTLRIHRAALDESTLQWAATLTDAACRRTMRYANTSGVQREHPAWQAITHFFNHQTHHRGQVTTLLMQQGIDVGVTDLIALV